MKRIHENKTPDINLNNKLDAFCQEFDGGRFYGLEYILEDFFQSSTVKPSDQVRPTVDWFGLYN
jgi:hypothetical protein